MLPDLKRSGKASQPPGSKLCAVVVTRSPRAMRRFPRRRSQHASGRFDKSSIRCARVGTSGIPLWSSRWLVGRMVGKTESAEHERMRKALATWFTTQGLSNVKTPADPVDDMVPDVQADYFAKIVYGEAKLC